MAVSSEGPDPRDGCVSVDDQRRRRARRTPAARRLWRELRVLHDLLGALLTSRDPSVALSASSPGSGRRRPLAAPAVMRRIAARVIDPSRESLGSADDRYTMLPVGDVLYFFTPAATRGIVGIPSGTVPLLRPGGVYLRTAKGVFVTWFRSLAELRQRLAPSQFVQVHQSLVVNVDKIQDLDLSTTAERNVVGIKLPDGTFEWLTLSRRALRDLRATFGLPLRRRPSRTQRLRGPSA